MAEKVIMGTWKRNIMIIIQIRWPYVYNERNHAIVSPKGRTIAYIRYRIILSEYTFITKEPEEAPGSELKSLIVSKYRKR